MTAAFIAPIPALQTAPLTILITGASRGLGLELVRQYATAHTDNVVIGAVRSESSSTALSELANLLRNIHIVTLDVADEVSIKASVPQVTAITPHLDLLYNNAGIHGPDEARDPLKATKGQLIEVFNTNVVGVVLVTQAFAPLLAKSKDAKVVNVGSGMGSNAGAVKFGTNYTSLTYGTSKAALNYVSTVFRFALPNVTVLTIHPGWVDTDMGAVLGKAPNTPETSIQAIRHYITEKKLENSGEFLDVTTGNILPY